MTGVKFLVKMEQIWNIYKLKVNNEILWQIYSSSFKYQYSQYNLKANIDDSLNTSWGCQSAWTYCDSDSSMKDKIIKAIEDYSLSSLQNKTTEGSVYSFAEQELLIS